MLPFSGGGFTGALGLRTSLLAEAGRVPHPDGAPLARTLVIGDTPYTVSYRGPGANGLSDLSAIGFTPFG